MLASTLKPPPIRSKKPSTVEERSAMIPISVKGQASQPKHSDKVVPDNQREVNDYHFDIDAVDNEAENSSASNQRILKSKRHELISQVAGIIKEEEGKKKEEKKPYFSQSSSRLQPKKY